MYQLGIMFFFMHNNNDNDMKTASVYFEPILNSTTLTSAQRNLVGSLYRIGTYYGMLDSGRVMYLSDYSYADLWTDLSGMVDGNVSEKVGSPAFAIALYNQMSLQIFNNYEMFNQNGVSQGEMEQQLDLVESGLNSITVASTLLDMRNSALDLTNDARRAVASYFDRRG